MSNEVNNPVRFSIEVEYVEEPPEEGVKTRGELDEHLERLREWNEEHAPRNARDVNVTVDAEVLTDE